MRKVSSANNSNSIQYIIHISKVFRYLRVRMALVIVSDERKGSHSGEANLSLLFLPPPWRSTLKGKNLLPLEQILSNKNGFSFGRVSSFREACRKSYTESFPAV